MKRVAIIGAGLSGLTLARQLQDSAEVRIFDKSRGCGGRMAARTRGNYQFDHGAQFFTARSKAFKQFIQPYIERGVVARWDARFVEFERNSAMLERIWAEDPPHYVAVPGMDALGRAMASTLDVQLETEVATIQKTASAWQLIDKQGNELGSYDWVIVTIPAMQAQALIPEDFKHIDVIENKQMLGCYSLMLGFEQPLPLSWDAALVRQADISWISVNSSKPGRTGGYTLLVHATNKWADENIELGNASVIEHLMHETASVIQQDISRAAHIDLHRWRYANIKSQHGDRSLVDTDNRLAAIGDWCIKGRIESAFQSGMDAATKIQEAL